MGYVQMSPPDHDIRVFPCEQAVQPDFQLQRFAGNPIISSRLDPQLSAGQSEGGYVNINGPAVIRVPAWIENRLGQYYLYFAHHKGHRIRMAYADSPTGPWTLYRPGTRLTPAQPYSHQG